MLDVDCVVDRRFWSENRESYAKELALRLGIPLTPKEGVKPREAGSLEDDTYVFGAKVAKILKKGDSIDSMDVDQKRVWRRLTQVYLDDPGLTEAELKERLNFLGVAEGEVLTDEKFEERVAALWMGIEGYFDKDDLAPRVGLPREAEGFDVHKRIAQVRFDEGRRVRKAEWRNTLRKLGIKDVLTDQQFASRLAEIRGRLKEVSAS